MAVATRSGKNGIDKQVEEFCSASAELLANIHERCNNKGNGKKPRKGRRGRKKKGE
jgi:hypothetical protein